MSSNQRLTDLLSYNQPTAGAMLFALGQLEGMLSGQGGQPALSNDELKRRVKEAIKANTHSRAVAFDWRKQRRAGPLQRQGIGQADGRMDRAVSQFAGAIDKWAQMEMDCEEKRLAIKMRDELFPQGVGVTTSLRYEDEHAAVDEIIKRSRAEFGPELDRLALRPFLVQMELSKDDYGARLTNIHTKRITHDQVQEAHRAGLHAYFSVILRIWDDYVDAAKTRARLLAPIDEQDGRVSAYRKRRGVAPEVDPVSGEVVDEDELEAEAAEAAAAELIPQPADA